MHGMEIMEKTDMCQKTRRHVGVCLCFRDVYFLRGSFRREKIPFFPRDRPLCSLSEFEALIRMQTTERFKPISLDFGFAYGDRSFSCKAAVISFSNQAMLN